MVIIAVDPARNELGVCCYASNTKNMSCFSVVNQKTDNDGVKIKYIYDTIKLRVAEFFVINSSIPVDKIIFLCERGFGVGGVSESLERVRGVIELIAAQYGAEFIQIHPSTWKSYWRLGRAKPDEKFIKKIIGINENDGNIRDAICFLVMFLQKNYSEVFDASEINFDKHD